MPKKDFTTNVLFGEALYKALHFIVEMVTRILLDIFGLRRAQNGSNLFELDTHSIYTYPSRSSTFQLDMGLDIARAMSFKILGISKSVVERSSEQILKKT